MAIPVIQFQPETFAQANPVLTGMNVGYNTIQNAVAAQYAQPLAQQNLLKAQLSNQILQPQAQYAPQMTRAALAAEQQQAPLLKSETALNQARVPFLGAQTYNIYHGQLPLELAEANKDRAQVPLFGAQTKLYNQEAQYFPETTKARMLAAYGKVLPYTPLGMLKSLQNSPTFQALVAQNKPLAQQTVNLMTNSIMNGLGIPGLGGLGGGTGIPASPSAADVATVQSAAGSDYLKKTTPQNILNQRYYDSSVNNMLDKVAPDLPQIAHFAGIAGQAGQNADKYAAAMGLKSSDAYKKYNNFVNVQAPLIGNEIRRALGGQATDKEIAMTRDISNPISWKNNFDLTMAEFNALRNQLAQNSAAISQSPFQNLQTIQNEGTGRLAGLPSQQRKNIAKFTDRDIAYTARQYGLSPAQVKARLQQEGYY